MFGFLLAAAIGKWMTYSKYVFQTLIRKGNKQTLNWNVISGKEETIIVSKNISEEERGFENILKMDIYCEIKKKYTQVAAQILIRDFKYLVVITMHFFPHRKSIKKKRQKQNKTKQKNNIKESLQSLAKGWRKLHLRSQKHQDYNCFNPARHHRKNFSPFYPL